MDLSDYYLQLRDIVKKYPGVTALNHVSLDIELGKVIALLGENGAGKSTLIKVMSGAIAPTSGSIVANGQSYTQMNPMLSKKLGIGVIYQELNLMPAMSVTENIFVGNEIMKNGLVDKKAMRSAAIGIFRDMGIELDVDAKVGSLSIAYQQMVEIAKSISRELKVLVMDEPTSSLSNKEVDQMFRVVRKLTARGIAIVYISHRLEEIDNFADQITILRDGELVKSMPAEGVTHDDIIRYMIGRELALDYYPDRSDVSYGEEVLRVEGLSLNQYVKDVSFSIRKGEILGLAGLVGSGRTTVARGIFGASPLDNGSVFVEGKKISARSPVDAIKAGIVMAPEDRKKEGALLAMSCRHNISFPSINIGILTKLGIINRKMEEEISEKQIKSLRIKTPSQNQKARLLSGGNQQKLVIGKWIATSPKVLIFDEPTRGIDVGAKHEIYEIMDQMARNGAAILVISSEMPELIGVSDRIVCMYEGRVIGELTREQAEQERIMRLCSGIRE